MRFSLTAALTALLVIRLSEALAFFPRVSRVTKVAKFNIHRLDRPSRPSALFAIKGPVRYSANDWFDCLSTLPTSRILARTKYHIFVFTIWSAVLTLAYKTVGSKWPVIPSAVHSILGAALSLLLVFRTNSSYDR